jgi:hypothetical protein
MPTLREVERAGMRDLGVVDLEDMVGVLKGEDEACWV